MSKTNKHRGGDFRNLLKEEGILREVDARALKQAMNLRFKGPDENQKKRASNVGPDVNPLTIAPP